MSHENKNPNESEKGSAISSLKNSVNTILHNPILLVPVISGVVVLALLDSLVDLIAWNYTEDPFTGFWFEDLSWFPTQYVLFSYLCLFAGLILFYSFYFMSIYMAKDIKLNLKPDIKKSLNPTGTYIRLPLFAAILIGQALLMTVVLVPFGLLVLVIAVVDNDSIGGTLSKAIKFFRSKPLDIVILSLAWLIPRAIFTAISLMHVPYAFQISAITDLIAGVALVNLYMSSNPSTQPPAS
jgi:hypothetical protein